MQNFVFILVALYTWWWPSSISFHLKVTPTYQTMSDWLVPLHHQGAYSHLCSWDENLQNKMIIFEMNFHSSFSFFLFYITIFISFRFSDTCCLFSVSLFICDGSLHIRYVYWGHFHLYLVSIYTRMQAIRGYRTHLRQSVLDIIFPV